MSKRLLPILDAIEFRNMASLRATILASGGLAGVLRTDTGVVAAWIALHVKAESAFKEYRRNAERLLLWLEVRGLILAQLTEEIINEYFEFLKVLEPTDLWMSNSASISRDDIRWRPFCRIPNENTGYHVQMVTVSLVKFLDSIDYCHRIKMSAIKVNKRPSTVSSSLSKEEWALLVKFVESWPRVTTAQKRRYHRSRFLLHLLFAVGLTGTDFVTASMGQIFSIAHEDGSVEWNFLMLSADGNLRCELLSDEIMAEVRLYRLSMGLSDYPYFGEKTPLLMPVRGRNTTMSEGLTKFNRLYDAIINGVESYARIAFPDLINVAKGVSNSRPTSVRNAGIHAMAESGLDLVQIAEKTGLTVTTLKERFLLSTNKDSGLDSASPLVSWEKIAGN